MAKYRKKPVVIDAVQWTGNNNSDILNFTENETLIDNFHETVEIKTLEGIMIASKGDFIINDNYLFEVGGKKKGFDQIADVPNSFLAVDDTEIGYGNRIPLWMFGMLY